LPLTGALPLTHSRSLPLFFSGAAANALVARTRFPRAPFRALPPLCAEYRQLLLPHSLCCCAFSFRWHARRSACHVPWRLGIGMPSYSGTTFHFFHIHAYCYAHTFILYRRHYLPPAHTAGTRYRHALLTHVAIRLRTLARTRIPPTSAHAACCQLPHTHTHCVGCYTVLRLVQLPCVHLCKHTALRLFSHIPFARHFPTTHFPVPPVLVRQRAAHLEEFWCRYHHLRHCWRRGECRSRRRYT